MDKHEFINMFKEYDKNYIAALYEDIELCKKIDYDVYTKEFVTPDIYYKLKKNECRLGVNVSAEGYFQECERRVICFSIGESNNDYSEFHVVKISNKSRFRALMHRDYLGALMSLGVKRELFGDLVVDGDSCFLPVSMGIAQYISDNLTSVANCPCKVQLVDLDKEILPDIKFQDSIVLSSSLRLDNVVSGICNISRAKAVSLIDGGMVLVNYISCDRKDKLIEVNDTMTIRGYGKYKLRALAGETAKGRTRMQIGKYI